MKSKFVKIGLVFCLIPIFQFGIFVNTASAETAYLPDWVWNLYHYWIDERISENELVNAIDYLEEQKIIELIMHKEYDTKTNFLLSILVLEKSNSENEFDSCTFDWYITGYFLPVESDYSGKLVEISVDEVKQFYVADFLEVVRTEGWGRTNAGNYLGWYHDLYHISDTYLDSQGNDLVVGTVAVDALVIEHGSELIIPTLPEPWNSMVFSALDEGPSIIGKHIDVFTGEGVTAENETFRITSSNNNVCAQTEYYVI